MNSSGVPIVMEDEPNGMARFNQEYVLAGEDVYRASQDATPRCTSTFTSEIDMAWAKATAQLTAVLIEESRAWIGSCVHEAGLGDFNPVSTKSQAETEAYARCSEEWKAFVRVPVVFGMVGDGAPAVNRER